MIDEEKDLIITTLKSYISPIDFDLHNWDIIINRREQYKKDVFIYKLAFVDIYLTDDLELYDIEPKT